MLSVGLLLGVSVFSAGAQENLYGPAAPLDVAYLRVVHAAEGFDVFIPASGETLLTSVGFAEVTPYYPLEPGEADLSLGDVAGIITLEAGAFYTAVFFPGDFELLTDEPLIDASRALLTLYNLTDLEGLRLTTLDGATQVTEPAGANSGVSAVINQAEVALAVRAGEEQVGELAPQLWERGVAHSVFVFAGAEGPELRYVAAELAAD